MADALQVVRVGGCFNYAACVAGEAGVRHRMTLLQQEVSRNLATRGVNTLAQPDASYLLKN